MWADRLGCLQIPFPRVVVKEGFVGEDSGRTDLHQISAEFVLQRAILFPAEVDGVMRAKHVEVTSARIVSVVSYAAVTLNTPIHLMPNEWAERLIAMGSFLIAVAPVDMPGHDRHVL